MKSFVMSYCYAYMSGVLDPLALAEDQEQLKSLLNKWKENKKMYTETFRSVVHT